MDGNGRWAKRRGRVRVFGHENGAESLRRITRFCRRIGVRETTFYALSTENYQRRPQSELRFLMRLLERFLIDERPELTENGIRLTVIGDVSTFPVSVRRELDTTMRLTEDLDAMTLRLALNYGSRQEILEAVRRIAAEVAAGRLRPEELESLDEEMFRTYLEDPEMTDPDLVVRTAGELRLSNFLLWQASYSEWWITDTLWPDFDVPHLEEALRAYAGRERRYGAIHAIAPAPAPAIGFERGIAERETSGPRLEPSREAAPATTARGAAPRGSVG